MKYKLVLISVIVFLSCNKNTLKEDIKNQDFFVEFYYHNQGALYPMRYACGKLKSGNTNSNLNYKKIEGREFTEKVISYYSVLNNVNEERFDARIHLLVHTQKSVDTICMGEDFGVVVNGITKEDSKEFINFIKSEIYGNAPN